MVLKKTWRLPGQPYMIEVDGLKIKCKSLSKEEQIQVREALIKHTPTKESFDELHKLLNDRIISIEGVDDVDELLSFNLNKFPVLVSSLLFGDALKEVEEKNSESSSG